MKVCLYCGRTFKNVYVHERTCKSKPLTPISGKEEVPKQSPSQNLEKVSNLEKKTNQESKTESVIDPEILKKILEALNKPISTQQKTEVLEKPKESYWSYFVRNSFLFAPLRWIHRIKQKPEDISTNLETKAEPKPESKINAIENVLSKLPRWAIKEHKPWFVGENKKRKLIQFVGISRLKPPVMAWLFWDGIFISMEDRLYQPPHDIRGDVFFYDLDNSRPLLDNIKEDEETHESLRMAQVKNIAYAMGRIAGAQDLLKNLGLILIGVCIILLVGIVNAALSWQVVQGFSAANSQIGNITTAVNHYITTHP